MARKPLIHQLMQKHYHSRSYWYFRQNANDRVLQNHSIHHKSDGCVPRTINMVRCISIQIYVGTGQGHSQKMKVSIKSVASTKRVLRNPYLPNTNWARVNFVLNDLHFLTTQWMHHPHRGWSVSGKQMSFPHSAAQTGIQLISFITIYKSKQQDTQAFNYNFLFEYLNHFFVPFLSTLFLSQKLRLISFPTVKLKTLTPRWLLIHVIPYRTKLKIKK